MTSYAHTVPGRPPEEWEPLERHLAEVAELAGELAGAVVPGGCAEAAAWGRLLGRMHDFGKFQPAFQQYLHASGAGEGPSSGPPHAAAGALWLCKKRAVLAAFAVDGHHAGLPDNEKDDPSPPPRAVVREFHESMKRAESALAESVAGAGDFVFPDVPPLPAWLPTDDFRAMEFFGRMLFSALVDADRRCTAAFGARAEGKVLPDVAGSQDDLATLRDRLATHLDHLAADAPATPVNAARAEVLAACRAAADLPPGVFSLTVPTGGGKTLAAMDLALRHACTHDRRRVIVAIPYTSIIEQNARVYRDVLGGDNVLEHHANLDVETLKKDDPDREDRRQLAAENWDAPVVVTTNVQLFESCFTARPGKARKLHHVAGSVLVLDEVQTLPPKLLAATLDALRELTTRYGCTVILCTATPPALAEGPGRPWGLPGVREVVPDPAALAERLRRVRVTWADEQVWDTRRLADEVAARERSLTILHRRGDARELAAELIDRDVPGVFHLSALMCPAHRLRRLAEVRARMKGDGPVRLVATQLVEAGVDLDFPVVLRSAVGGLDAYAQAAGRCDREGRATAELGGPAGELIVFRPEDDGHGTMRTAAEAANSVRSRNPGLDLFDPASATAYFRELYEHRVDPDQNNVQLHRERLHYSSVDHLYRLIDDAGDTVLVPYQDEHIDGPARLARYLAEPTREHRRALQPLGVQLPHCQINAMRDAGMFDPTYDPLTVLATTHTDSYDAAYGLMPDRQNANPETTIC